MSLSSAEQKFEELKQEYFSAVFVPLKKLYVDLEMIQDLRLGALLTLINTEPEYEYILHRLPNYGGRFDDMTMKYFPVISDITDKDIDARLADTAWHERIVRASPMTAAFDILRELILYMHTSNTKCDKQNTRIEVTIGTSSVLYSQKAKQILIDTLTTHDKYLDIVFLNRALENIEVETRFTYDIYMFYNIAKILQHSDLGTAICTKLALLNKRVYAYPILERTPTPDLTAETLLVNTKVVMDVLCDFTYIERGLQAQV